MNYYVHAVGKQALVGLVSLASVLTVFSYFGNYDPPVSVISAKASNDPVIPGGKLRISWEVERSRRCYAMFDREMYDAHATRFELPNVTKEGGRRVTAYETYSTEVDIPSNFAEGPGKYISTSLYSCNLFQYWKPIVVPSPEVEFMVMARK